jgi:hypothetical protein
MRVHPLMVAALQDQREGRTNRRAVFARETRHRKARKPAANRE